VIILRDVEESIHKFRRRLKDLASFYTRENAENRSRHRPKALSPHHDAPLPK
jgi:hypothetical protein